MRHFGHSIVAKLLCLERKNIILACANSIQKKNSQPFEFTISLCNQHLFTGICEYTILCKLTLEISMIVRETAKLICVFKNIFAWHHYF